jgi:predicted Rossmann fold nucleotide-binding protein DprA/Smf involved in DNA uptake
MELSRLPAPVAAIITGGARGVDMAAEAYALAAGIALTVIRPDYRRYRRCAPLVRNKQIVDLADVVLAFWDGHSRGTAQALDYARKQNKEVRLCQTAN